MATAANEKRKYPRTEGETLVRFDGENFSIYSRATDWSEGGAFLATHYLLEPGTNLEVHLFHPDSGEATSEARVVRTIYRGEDDVNPAQVGLGIEFQKQ